MVKGEYTCYDVVVIDGEDSNYILANHNSIKSIQIWEWKKQSKCSADEPDENGITPRDHYYLYVDVVPEFIMPAPAHDFRSAIPTNTLQRNYKKERELRYKKQFGTKRPKGHRTTIEKLENKLSTHYTPAAREFLMAKAKVLDLKHFQDSRITCNRMLPKKSTLPQKVLNPREAKQ